MEIGGEEEQEQQCRRWRKRGRIANFDSDQTDTFVHSSSFGMRFPDELQDGLQDGHRKEGLVARLFVGRVGRIGIDRYPFWSG